MARLTRRGSAWVLSWADPTQPGKQIRRSLGAVTAQEAEIALSALKVQLATGRGDLLPLIAPRVRVRDLAADYLSWRAEQFPDSQPTVAIMFNTHILPALGGHEAAKLTAADVETLLHTLRTTHQPKSVALVHNVLKAMYTWAVARHRVLDNPCALVTPPQDVASKPHRWYRPAELERLYAADSAHAHIWQFLANTGLRRTELSHLKWADVHGTTLHVISQQGARTKSAKWRPVVMVPAAQEALKRFPRTSEYVLTGTSAKRLTDLFHAALLKAEIAPPIGSLHCLRHTFCTRLVQQGVPLRAVQVLAGHSSVTITENYAHIDQSYLENLLKEVTI